MDDRTEIDSETTWFKAGTSGLDGARVSPTKAQLEWRKQAFPEVLKTLVEHDAIMRSWIRFLIAIEGAVILAIWALRSSHLEKGLFVTLAVTIAIFGGWVSIQLVAIIGRVRQWNDNYIKVVREMQKDGGDQIRIMPVPNDTKPQKVSVVEKILAGLVFAVGLVMFTRGDIVLAIIWILTALTVFVWDLIRATTPKPRWHEVPLALAVGVIESIVGLLAWFSQLLFLGTIRAMSKKNSTGGGDQLPPAEKSAIFRIILAGNTMFLLSLSVATMVICLAYEKPKHEVTRVELSETNIVRALGWIADNGYYRTEIRNLTAEIRTNSIAVESHIAEIRTAISNSVESLLTRMATNALASGSPPTAQQTKVPPVRPLPPQALLPTR